jgi:hypothetical protein
MLQTSSILSSLFFPLRSKGTNRCDRLISAPAHPLLFFGDVRRMRARVTAKFKNKIKTIYLHTQTYMCVCVCVIFLFFSLWFYHRNKRLLPFKTVKKRDRKLLATNCARQ